MELYFTSDERYYLQKLSKVLNYHLSTSLLFILSFFSGILLTAAIIAAMIFVPIMLYIFFRLKKTSWIISFCIIVLMPLIISIILGLEIGYLSVFLLISLAFFYCYFFILKYMVNDRLHELIAREELEVEKNAEKYKTSAWESQFKNKNATNTYFFQKRYY